MNATFEDHLMGTRMPGKAGIKGATLKDKAWGNRQTWPFDGMAGVENQGSIS